MAYAYVNTGEAAPESYVLRLGDPHARLDTVSAPAPPVIRAGYRIPAESPGRRTAFANWLAWPANPLTARVMVNRIRQFRIGDGLVRTPNDFGVMGDKPAGQCAAGLAGGGVCVEHPEFPFDTASVLWSEMVQEIFTAFCGRGLFWASRCTPSPTTPLVM